MYYINLQAAKKVTESAHACVKPLWEGTTAQLDKHFSAEHKTKVKKKLKRLFTFYKTRRSHTYIYMVYACLQAHIWPHA